MNTKALRHVKAEGDAGYVEAVFSTFNVIDHDGDVTEPGAFEKGAPVRVSAYGHRSWQGVLPIGRGEIDTTESEAVLKAQLFVNTTAGRETFEVLKGMGDLSEWSYGFEILAKRNGQFDEKDVRFLEKLKVNEVSPVLLGAGINTRTLALKDYEELSEDEVAERALVACKALLDRGLMLPDELVEAVRQKDAETAETNRRDGMLRLIAASHGINGGEQ